MDNVLLVNIKMLMPLFTLNLLTQIYLYILNHKIVNHQIDNHFVTITASITKNTSKHTRLYTLANKDVFSPSLHIRIKTKKK
jgi:hypothetical protein